MYDSYVFEKNLAGDIVAIYDTTATKIVSYSYDAWGNFTTEGTQAATIGALTPFRYRGYYFDPETNLYYLQSRYYNASWGRFLNADGYVSTGAGILGYNMFAYCNNNPAVYIDPNGYSPYGILTIRDYYKIHRNVQNLCKQEGWLTEVYVVGTEEYEGTRGYLDLYDPLTNTFYEVKSHYVANTEATAKQLERYEKSLVKSKKVQPLPKDYPQLGEQEFSGWFEYGIYDVDYSTEDGLIVYEVSKNKTRSDKLIEELLENTAEAIGLFFSFFMVFIPGALMHCFRENEENV